MRNHSANPDAIFRLAEQYFRAHQHLLTTLLESKNFDKLDNGLSRLHKSQRFMNPTSVLQAFSLELFLKGISAARYDGAFLRTHNLWELFDNLPIDDKLGIRLIYDEPNPFTKSFREQLDIDKCVDSLKETLKQDANAYIALRYSYERDDDLSVPWFSGITMQVVRFYVFENFPEHTVGLNV